MRVSPYRRAIDTTLGDRVDFAVLITVYRTSQEGEARYSPAEVSAVEVVRISGEPDSGRICTSIVARQNLSVRTGTRRFTRLTNAFTKKWENHWAAVVPWFAFYNFCRVHRTLKMPPQWPPGSATKSGAFGNCWRQRSSVPWKPSGSFKLHKVRR